MAVCSVHYCTPFVPPKRRSGRKPGTKVINSVQVALRVINVYVDPYTQGITFEVSKFAVVSFLYVLSMLFQRNNSDF